MDYPLLRQPRPRLAIIASFTFIATFVIWLLLPRSPVTHDDVPHDDDVPIPVVSKAIAVLRGEMVSGTIAFTQAWPAKQVIISCDIRNLKCFSKRGLHIHAFGDLSDGCTSTGHHFNPLLNTHGGPGDTNRHVGDLGNLEVDGSGMAIFKHEESWSDHVISLNGPLSIIGRAVVITVEADDLGRGGANESLTTGNAGAPIACGIVGVAD